MAKPKLWLGLSAAGVALLTLVVAAQKITADKAGIINDALGLSQSKVDVVTNDELEGSAYKDAKSGALTDEGWNKMIEDSYNFCEEAVEQGSVVFKNVVKDGKPTLPLAENERKVTLLGRGSKNLFMRSGAGGAAPNPSLKVTMDKAFSKKNGYDLNKTVYDAYSTLSLSNMTSPSTTVESYSEINKDNLKSTFKNYPTAIITFVRIGTENTDPSDGNLNLNSNERQVLQLAKQYKDSGDFKKVIVLINSPLPMSMDWVDKEEYGIDAVVYVGVPGYYGAGGIAHLLAGEKTVKDENGNDVVKVVNPSGHAPDTFAASASSSPAYVNFNRTGTNQSHNEPNAMAVYQEGIYVGYKYYETRYEDLVLNQGNAGGTKGKFNSASNWNYADEMGYPFGYGQSYTTFEQKLTSLTYDETTDKIKAHVEVTNTGNMDGQASVQLYVQAPYTDFDKTNKLGKSAIALMQYAKVDVPVPTEENPGPVEVDLEFDRYFLTTYDYVVNKTYILEGGTYYFGIGNGAHEALNNIISVKHPGTPLYDHNGTSYTGKSNAVKSLEIAENKTKYAKSIYNPSESVTNQFDDADYNFIAEKNGKSKITYLDRTNWEGTWPTKITSNPANSNDMNMNKYTTSSSGAKYNGRKGIDYEVTYKDENDEESLIKFNEMYKVPLEGDVTDETSRFYGQDGAKIWDAFVKQMSLDDLCISVSDNRGILDVKKVLKKGNSVAEGPEGLLSRYQYGDKRWATGFPTGPTYTGTWDHKMQAKFGEFYGEDALFCGVACVNAPGANINRTPYGSRASEYMSEDAILNYNTAANIVGAARKKGLIMNIKHCFLNNQETARQGIFTYCNEQAIREIYLKPFEGALTKGKGLGIMTSYNRIGAKYAACHTELMQNVMRKEWKYQGLIIDDALTGSNTDGYSNGPAMLHAGTDLFCLDGGRGGQLKSKVTGSDDGEMLKDLQRANKHIMYAISRSWMGSAEFSAEAFAKPMWQQAIDGTVIGTSVVAAVLVGLYAFFEISSKIKSAKAKEEVPASENIEG